MTQINNKRKSVVSAPLALASHKLYCYRVILEISFSARKYARQPIKVSGFETELHRTDTGRSKGALESLQA
jgi:hypothetical protein